MSFEKELSRILRITAADAIDLRRLIDSRYALRDGTATGNGSVVQAVNDLSASVADLASEVDGFDSRVSANEINLSSNSSLLSSLSSSVSAISSNVTFNSQDIALLKNPIVMEAVKLTNSAIFPPVTPLAVPELLVTNAPAGTYYARVSVCIAPTVTADRPIHLGLYDTSSPPVPLSDIVVIHTGDAIAEINSVNFSATILLTAVTDVQVCARSPGVSIGGTDIDVWTFYSRNNSLYGFPDADVDSRLSLTKIDGL